MKKLLLLICLVIGSFSVNAQLSCADAIVLTASGTYTVATISGENPTGVCFIDEVDPNGDPILTDWYAYTAVGDGTVTIIADGTTDTSISVFVGTCDALECYDNTGLNGGAELSFAVEAGVTYYIGFDSFFSAESFSFDFVIGTCSAPAGVNAPTNVSFSSATLNWEVASGNPLQYEVLYGPLDFPLEEGISATTFTNSLSLTGLNPSGNYDYYIRSVCGGSDKSLWIGPFELVLLKTVPYATGYDTLDELAGLRVSGAYEESFFIDFTPDQSQSPELYWVFNNTETEAVNNWVFTPAISLTAGQVINTSFYVYTTSPTANRSLRVTMGTSRAAIDQSSTIYSNTSLNANVNGYELITSPDFIVPTTGIYYIGINDFSPANAVPTSMFFDTFSVNTGTLGTNDFVANQFSVFPNPVKNIVSITNVSDINVSAIAITDLNGRIVKKQSFNNISNISMNVSDLAAGVYMMNITSDKGTATKKIIKN